MKRFVGLIGVATVLLPTIAFAWTSKPAGKTSTYEEVRIECDNGEGHHVRHYFKDDKWYGTGMSSNYGYSSLEAIAKVKCGS